MNKKFEDVIAEQGRLIYTNVGDSMFPIIREGDLLVIEAIKEPLKVGDVPLYKRDNGQYVMHRIVGMDRGKYEMKGDNRSVSEKGIEDRHMIGILTGIVRNGKTFPVETVEEYTARIGQDLIELVSCAVNDETPDKERIIGMDLREIYRMAQAHMLTAAVAFALEKTVPLPRAFDQAQKKAIRKLSLFEIERAAITREFENAGIRYLPLKGILLKDDYPKSAMREMTDNDILVDHTRMEDVFAIMQGFGYTREIHHHFNHDAYSKPPTLEFEMHYTLFGDDNLPVFDAYFADIFSKTTCSGCACRLSDEDFYLYVLCHMYKHYVNGGTGLRSLLDVYVFLRAHPDLDREYLDAELQKLQIADFEEKARLLANKVFTGSELNEQEQKELNYLLLSGQNGTIENAEYHHLAKALGNDDSSAAKRRLLKSRFFISGKALENQYPFFAKHKALYPVLLVYRPIKGIVTHPKGILKEYKKIKRFKKKEES